MKKDFSNVPKTSTILDAIATGSGKPTETAAPEAERKPAGMGTQGRKGVKLSRYNLGLTPENKEFIQVVARATGQTQNGFINAIIDAYREAHPEAVARAREVLEIINK